VPQLKTIHLVPDVRGSSCMEEHHLQKSWWAYAQTHNPRHNRSFSTNPVCQLQQIRMHYSQI